MLCAAKHSDCKSVLIGLSHRRSLKHLQAPFDPLRNADVSSKEVMVLYLTYTFVKRLPRHPCFTRSPFHFSGWQRNTQRPGAQRHTAHTLANGLQQGPVDMGF
jgi:hypothetical protein